MLWVWITLGAAAVQTWRFVLQKRLAATGLSVGGATFSRFLFGAPLAALCAAVLLGPGGAAVPLPGARFWAAVLIGGAAQVAATFLTVALFGLRNFAVGVAFTKTEVVQVAAFSALVLGERVPPAGLAGIVLGLIGVVLLSRGAAGARIAPRPVLYGLGAGALFAISAVAYRGATLELLPAGFFARAIVTLACVTLAQSLGMALWLRLFEPGEISRVLGAWRRTIWVGVAGILGSAGWFSAFALQGAAWVRAVGQVEMVFTLLASVLIFRERLSAREGAGIALVIVALIVIVLAGG